MEKQHNQDKTEGFASIKLDMDQGDIQADKYGSNMHNPFKMFCSNK
jgi:hypothetical protein